MYERAAADRCCVLRTLNEPNPTTGPAKRAKGQAWKGEQSLGETRILPLGIFPSTFLIESGHFE